MDDRNLMVKAGAWYTVANFLTKSIGFITTPLFTRFLTHEEFGLYGNYTSWMQVFGTFVALNLASTFISARYDYEDRFDEYVFSVQTLSFISSLVWALLLNLFSDWAVEAFGVSRLHLNCMILTLMFTASVELFQTRERYLFHYKMSVFLGLLSAVASSLLSVVLVVLMDDKLSGRIIGGVIPVLLIGTAVGIYIARKGKRVRIKYWKYALPICLPFIPHLLSLSILHSFDRAMITNICGPADNALYSLAYTSSMVVSTLASSMNGAFAPWLGGKLHSGEFAEIRSLSKKYVLLFVSLALGLELISPEVILLLGGRSYLPAKYVMPPVMFGCVCQFLYTMYVNVEQFEKKTISMAVASISAAVLNIVLNAIFIPRYGYIAAAYTTLVSYIWLLAIHMFVVSKIGYRQAYDYGFVILVVIVSSVVTVLVNLLYSHNVVRAVIVAIYASAVMFVALKYKDLILSVLFKKGK